MDATLLQDQLACSNLIARWYHCLDERQYQEITELVAPDAVWFVGGKQAKGPAEILAALNLRDPTAKTAHVLTNLVIDLGADGTGVAMSYVQVFKPAPASPDAKGNPSPTIHNFLRCKDQLRKVDGQWKIAVKKSTAPLA